MWAIWPFFVSEDLGGSSWWQLSSAGPTVVPGACPCRRVLVPAGRSPRLPGAGLAALPCRASLPGDAALPGALQLQVPLAGLTAAKKEFIFLVVSMQ